MNKLIWISTSVRRFQEPERDETKAKAKRIIVYSIEDHLIPNASSLMTPKGSVRCYDEAIKVE